MRLAIAGALCLLAILLEDLLDGLGVRPFGLHLSELGIAEALAHTSTQYPPSGGSKRNYRITQTRLARAE
jgi:hypothetical protein